jgi:hypothetical protein
MVNPFIKHSPCWKNLSLERSLDSGVLVAALKVFKQAPQRYRWSPRLKPFLQNLKLLQCGQPEPSSATSKAAIVLTR